MTPIPALLPLSTLVLALTASLQPVLQQNAAYASAGEKQARRDIRVCLMSGEFERSPTHPDITRRDDSRAIDVFAKKEGERDPAFERAVERCLEQKGYQVDGWE